MKISCVIDEYYDGSHGGGDNHVSDVHGACNDLNMMSLINLGHDLYAHADVDVDASCAEMILWPSKCQAILQYLGLVIVMGLLVILFSDYS